MELIDKKDFNC